VRDIDAPASDASREGVRHVVLPGQAAATRRAVADDAPLVHALYLATPEYFDLISIPGPTLEEVRTDLETAARDPRRHIELVVEPNRPPLADAERFADAITGGWVVGYLDYKVDYPDLGDVTVNLLLVHGALHDRGIGRRTVRDFEARWRGVARRVLASIYGRNPGARRFWEGLGYTFAIDARPILDWYAKSLA